MEQYESAAHYEQALRERADLPEGFRCGVAGITFVPRERPAAQPYAMNIALLLVESPTPSFAAVLTSNSFCGHPVTHAKKHLTMPVTRGVLVNNKIANVGSPRGGQDIDRIVRSLAAAAGGDPEDYFSASTGIVGWSLPVPEMTDALPGLAASAQSGSFYSFARAIMTTDRYPKVRKTRIGSGSIVACAKGAGMIEPNLATMLAFVTTDVDIERRELQQVLERVGKRTFNRISVDGDQSTSDMVIALSSRRKPPVTTEQFEAALLGVCGELAEDIVRNGEGTSHVMRVRVGSARDEREAVEVGKAIVNSPLVKTAVFGNDPNVGRILAAVGDRLGNDGAELDLSAVRLSIGTNDVFRDGAFRLDHETEGRLSEYLKAAQLDPKVKGFPAHDRCVEIAVELGRGRASAASVGSDLSYDYVRENADYRT